MLATFRSSIAPMTHEFNELAREAGGPASLRSVVVEGAMEQLRAGEAETHDRLIAERARELADCDAVVLAQFSTARAADAIRAVIRVPVLTAPHAAVVGMREAVLR